MRPSYQRVAALGEVARRARELAARTMIFDIEPLIASWDSGQQSLDQGIALVLSEAAAVPGVLQRTGRYRTNGIEWDHGFLKERLRPMRGLKSVASAAIFIRGHALMRNIRAVSIGSWSPSRSGWSSRGHGTDSLERCDPVRVLG